MEAVRELEELDTKLKDLKKDFNTQMNAIDGDIKEFHKRLTDVIVKHPDLKSVVDFVVFTNDNLERTQKDMKGVVSDSMNEMINIKKEVVRNNIKTMKADLEKSQNKNNFSSGFWSKINTFKDLKWVISAVLMILIILGFIFVPETMIQALTWIAKIVI
jgi:hypothetical protein